MERIALIGYRGSGKSTVGPLLAERLGWKFIDADAVMEEMAGKSIAELFADDGEEAFRDFEETNFAVLLEQDRVVIATGGGIVLRSINCERLRAESYVVWLDADADTCWKRIQSDATSTVRRPNLAGGGFKEVHKLIAERRPLYHSTAHLRLDASQSPEALADAILQAWPSRRTPA